MYDSEKGKAIRQITDPWLLGLDMGKGSLPRNSPRKIWWMIEPYFKGGSSFAFVKGNVTVHQKKCITFILCCNYFCVKYFAHLCVYLSPPEFFSPYIYGLLMYSEPKSVSTIPSKSL